MKLSSVAFLLLCSGSLALGAQSTTPELAPAPAQAFQTQTFTCGKPGKGVLVLGPGSVYGEHAAGKQPAGFDLKTTPTVEEGFCTSTLPFFFSVAVPEGSYRVTVELGSPAAAVTTVRAEARRLEAEHVATPAGKSARRSFDVNVRYAEIAGADSNRVRLKPREDGSLDWDHKLTLEFNGTHPGFRSIRVEAIHEPTIYLAGDSTVVDQHVEPWAAWGQMLPRFLKPGVVVSNQAESGETVRSFQTEKRFEKIFSTLHKGDYLVFQFGHNDQKPENKVPIELYRQLLTTYVDRTREAGATPVLVTSMMRRSFDGHGKIRDTFAGYPQAMRAVATEKHVTLIDLNAMSQTMWEAMGPDGTLKAFVHYPANSFPGQNEAIADDTHFNSYGAYELARCVAAGLASSGLPLGRFVLPEARHFDPAHPDPASDVQLPVTPIPPQEGDVAHTRQL